jgi:hypothetical protein
MDQRGLLKETLRNRSRRVRPFAAPGREHVRQYKFARWARSLAVLLHRLDCGRGHSPRRVYGKSDATASSPAENPVHPIQLVATLYHAMGINPHTMVLNHLNQPRELVQAEPIPALFG